MKQWRCKVCGYIGVGETPPDVCPVCGAGAAAFEEVAGADQAGPEQHHQLQQVLFRIPCGLFMVSAEFDGKPNGMINNTVFQITDAPVQLLLGMDKQHLTTELIQKSQSFAVHFLNPDQLELVKRFGFQSGRELDKFIGLDWRPGETGAPLLATAEGYLECRIRADKTIDAGTHLVFLGEVVKAILKEQVPVLTYQEYRQRKQELW